MTQTETPELVSLQISPWSLKARWALKHHKVAYRTKPYLPVIGEWLLRWQLHKWSGKVTVPVLLTTSGPLWDSFDIALWADSHAASPPLQLFPSGKVEEMRRWNELCDAILFYGRQQLVQAALNDPAVRLRYLPPWLRGLGPVSDWIALWGVRKFSTKYSQENATASKDKAVEALEKLRVALKQGGGSYIVGGAFTYADIVMAVALQPVKPVGPPFSKMAGARPAMDLIPGACQEYEDLLAWRDEVFKKHFPLGTPTASEGSKAKDA